MSFGVPLSQLIVNAPKPISTGLTALDNELDGGFRYKSSYEIYGIPGIGKTWLASETVKTYLQENDDGKVLWITTSGVAPQMLLRSEAEVKERIDYIRITKFTELLYFYQKQVMSEPDSISQSQSPAESAMPSTGTEAIANDTNSNDSYRLVIIDGLSRLLNLQLHSLSKKNCTTLHDTKCRYLIILMTLITKYNNKNNACHVILNDSMNTTYVPENNGGAEDELEMVEDGFNFFVKSHNYLYENNKRRRVYAPNVIRSALVANNALGNRDSRWEIFIKRRIGIFWEWEDKVTRNLDTECSKKATGNGRCRVALVHKDRQKSSQSLNFSVVPFDIDLD
ncbi:RecA family profile 1 [Nakaseomyces glabratus]